MTVYKYIIVPGYIKSKNDGEIHYISASQLMRLYKVNPLECIVALGKYWHRGRIGIESLIVLRPRYDGNYGLEK